MAKGNYSISIGHEAVSENEVLGEKSIAIGSENKVDGVLGLENKV
ncbi:hypothetical protein JFL59_09255 [Histophilus somni]|nr:hypothetical protein [Histophilus somni]QQF70368.1 hypothetical protein JFL59_09255 [Histophilus somni]